MTRDDAIERLYFLVARVDDLSRGGPLGHNDNIAEARHEMEDVLWSLELPAQ